MCALSLFRQTHAARDSVTAMLLHCLEVNLYVSALHLTLLTSHLYTLLNFCLYTLLTSYFLTLLTSHLYALLNFYLYTLLTFCLLTLLTSHLYALLYLLSLYFADFFRRIAL